MEKTKVISVRLSESLIGKLDKATTDLRYWKRNAVIEQILQAVLDTADHQTLYEIARRNRYNSEGKVIKFESVPVIGDEKSASSV
jgi:metal-responsive CopG/Arc/MetJ family transcriptional regulator